ncbi:phasin family protein [Bacillus massilinigeriensis]|uniref:phasin family protein n=1 Tax=Bacillus massilionigeriensis TaxID=1805475 RepID=UPI00096ADE30|nr:phasin family protein [Bacillus massilionigeriensis]
MKNIFDQMISLGLGAAVASKEQIEKFVNDLVAKGELSKTESKEMVDRFIEKGEAAKKDLDEIVKTKVQQALKELNLVTIEELKELEKRIELLEKKGE